MKFNDPYLILYYNLFGKMSIKKIGGMLWQRLERGVKHLLNP